MGWCLACAQPKELEERTTRDRERKFQVCNACRKTHLTNRIVPDTARAMEQLARLYNIGEDSELLLRLVHCGEYGRAGTRFWVRLAIGFLWNCFFFLSAPELIKLYSDTRISRILTLWLNTGMSCCLFGNFRTATDVPFFSLCYTSFSSLLSSSTRLDLRPSDSGL